MVCTALEACYPTGEAAFRDPAAKRRNTVNRKLLRGIVAALVFVAVSGIVLWAASGEVQEIALEIGEDGTVTVLVTLVDQSGETQTVRLSLSTAAQLGYAHL
jgi:hypothetical protein